MKKFVYFLAAAIMLLAISPVNAAPQVGQAAPDFEATDTGGAAVKLGDLKGKKVILEWHNPECPFVVKHYGSGNMQKIQQDATAQDIVWITINSGAAGKQGHLTAETAAAYLAEQNAKPSHYVVDESGAIGRLYDAQTTPHMFVIDEQGILVYAGAIDDNSSADAASIEGANNYVTSALSDLAAGKPVTTPSTAPYGCGVKYGN